MDHRTLSHNKDHLDDWVEKLLDIRDVPDRSSAGGGRKTGKDARMSSQSLEFLGAQRQRYRVVFEELARQTAVHSTQLARLLTKVWDGADGVTSRYNHGYEKAHKRCSFLQDEMKRVAEEAMKHVDGSKIELDDVKMQLAISRAAVREREGRIDTLQHANRQLVAECDALRLTIGRFVDGHIEEERDDDDDEEDAAQAAAAQARAQAGSSDEPYPPTEMERIARARRQNLYEINDEINELLAQTSLEEQRQVKFLTDMDQLIASVDASAFERVVGEIKGFTVDGSSQTDEKEDELPDELKPPPSVDVEKIKGTHIPHQLRGLMRGYPKTMRIPSLMATLKQCMQMYLEKLTYDRNCMASGTPVLDVAPFVYFYMLKKYGLESLADMQVTQLVLALEHHRKHKRIYLLGEFVGVEKKAITPRYSGRDTSFIFSLLQVLRSQNEFNEGSINDKQAEIEINRKKAGDAVRLIFEAILPDGAAAVTHRVSTMPPPSESKNAKAVGLDELLDLTSATWMDVNDLWRQHLRYLFAKFALVFEVVQEMKFRDDFEREDTDCVLVQIQQAKGQNFIWRPARVVSRAFVGHGVKPLTEEERRMQKYKRGAADKEALQAEMREEGLRQAEAGEREAARQRAHELDPSLRDREAEGGGDDAQGDGRVAGYKEAVQMMKEEGFGKLLKLVNPGINSNEARALFSEGCKKMHARTMDEFDDAWWQYVIPKGLGAKPKKIENNKLRKKFLEMTQAGGEDPEAKAEKERLKKEKKEAKKAKKEKKKKAAADETSAVTGLTEADDATAATATTAGSVTTAGVGGAAKAGDDAEVPHVPIERDAEEGKKFWFSVNTKQTQWVAPYENDTFETEDFDMGVFIELFLERNILANSPFVRVLDKEPEDLWSNAEVYLQQIEDGMVPH